VEVVESIDGDGVVRTAGGYVVRTACDAMGRPVVTTYDGGRHTVEPERYEYDGDGRLRVIHESEGLWFTCEGSERLQPGGRLEVEHDEAGPVRIVGEHWLVWERPVMPWPERLVEGAQAVADACLAWTRAACREHDVPPGTEVFALMLVYVDQGSVRPTLSYGLQADRAAWLTDASIDGEELAINLLYLNGDHEGLNFVEGDDLADDWDLLREACIGQAGDPYRAVLGAVAARLADADFGPQLRRTDDFVVYIAEHDEGFTEKLASIRAHNPPQAVRRWEATWPDRAIAADDE
jgi:YD repeat-containing protein